MIYGFARIVLLGLCKMMFRLKAEGVHNIPANGPVILCSNHISTFDPPVVGVYSPRKVYFMAKEELFKIPVFGYLIAKVGAFPVKRGGVSKESIRHAITLLREGNMMGIFPEGSRSNAGGMGKKGAASLALKSEAVVIPAAIIGNYSLFRKMKVVYGEPVDLSEFKNGGSEDLEKATEKIMNTINSILHKAERS
jgi:1-acyl-sn-glycerol-3-phosphate acyltransferase